MGRRFGRGLLAAMLAVLVSWVVGAAAWAAPETAGGAAKGSEAAPAAKMPAAEAPVERVRPVAQKKGGRTITQLVGAVSDLVRAAAEGSSAADDSADDENDDWESDSGPVDKTPRISGAASASYRQTWFTERKLGDGTPVDKESTFQIEHTHLKFSGDLSNQLSWEIMPCVTHMDGFSVITANFEYQVAAPLKVTVGRFLLPFGGFNLKSLPGMYRPVSRPLLYVSHEDRFLQFSGKTPTNLLFTPREDIGLELSGNIWLGEVMQISYNAYVTNGLRSDSSSSPRHWDDNNNAKMVGGRLSGSYFAGPLTLGLGISGFYNRYEASLDQTAVSLNTGVSFDLGEGRKVALNAEYTYMTREIQPSATLLSGDEQVEGAYLEIEANPIKPLGFYYQWDFLQNTTPVGTGGVFTNDVELTMNRHIFGAWYTVADGLDVKAEYGIWAMPHGVPNAHRISLQTVITF